MLDLLIKNAEVIDGTGAPAKKINVGVKGGIITLKPDAEAKEVIDASGLTLCPGFVESHSHGDMSIGTHHGTMCKVSQGVTTEVGGQCGQSCFPVDSKYREELDGVMAFNADFAAMPTEQFVDFNAYIRYTQNLPLAMNMYSLVGHNTLRVSAMGVADRAPTTEELQVMKDRLKACMEQGAVGLSSGLIYIPGVYSTTEEVIELCKVIKPYGGVYATHMRNEARNVVEAVKESIYIAEQAGVPLVISHHKVCGRAFWGKSEETLRLIEEAAQRGLKIMVDQYPYEANQTALNVPIPPQYFAEGLPALVEKLKDPVFRKKVAAEMNDPDGGYDNFYLNSGGFTGVFIVSSPNVPEATGMFVSDYAKMVGKSDMDAYFDLLIANEGGGNGIYFAMDPTEVERIYCYPRTVVGSDGLCFADSESGHPRAWGTFVKPLARFCEEKHLVSFEEAVKKQTSMTADFWGLKNKGRIAEGYDADLVLLDRKTLKDTATWKDSNRKADGIEKVFVSGICVYENKDLTGQYPGRVLRCFR